MGVDCWVAVGAWVCGLAEKTVGVCGMFRDLLGWEV